MSSAPRLHKAAVRTDAAPGPTRGAPYSQAVTFGELVFVSGQLPVDPRTGELVDGGIEEQTERAMQNLAAVLAAAGSGLDHLLKTTVYLRDRDEWAAMNAVYARHVGAVPPARSAVEVGRMAFGARVELEAIAYRDAP